MRVKVNSSLTQHLCLLSSLLPPPTTLRLISRVKRSPRLWRFIRLGPLICLIKGYFFAGNKRDDVSQIDIYLVCRELASVSFTMLTK